MAAFAVNLIMNKNVYISLLLIVVYACTGIHCGAGSQVKKSEVEVAAVTPGAHYEGLYRSELGICYVNTSENTDTMLLPLDANFVVNTLPSPDKKKTAFAFYDTDNKVTNIYVVIPETRSFKWVKKNKGEQAITMAWENDSLLAASYAYVKRSGKRSDTTAGYSELLNINQNNVAKKYTPKRGTFIRGFIQSKYLIYADRGGFYLVDKTNNAVTKTIRDFTSIDDKGINFSPDGTKCLYFEKKGDRSSLHVSDYEGSNERVLFDYNYNPANAQWSPDGKRIACDIQSPDSASIRYLTFFDLNENKARFKKEESFSDVSSVINCGWSPSGNFILVEKKVRDSVVYAIRDLNRERDFVIRDSVTNYTRDKIGWLQFWPNDNQLIFLGYHGYTIYDAIENNFITLPGSKEFVYLNKLN